jgi:hypothetical protein
MAQVDVQTSQVRDQLASSLQGLMWGNGRILKYTIGWPFHYSHLCEVVEISSVFMWSLDSFGKLLKSLGDMWRFEFIFIRLGNGGLFNVCHYLVCFFIYPFYCVHGSYTLVNIMNVN